MKDRKLFGLFTGWQLTLLGCVAMLAPGVVYAAVSYTAVSIVDPNTGKLSAIDAGRRLQVYDPIAGYRNNPANLVNLQFSVGGNSGGPACVLQYTVPAGKALVITDVTATLVNLSGSGMTELYIDTNAGCSSPDPIGFFYPAYQPATYVESNLQSGVAIPAGSLLYFFTYNSNAYGFMRGYLVPAGAVPAAGSPEAAQTHGAVAFNKAALAKMR